jgi:hypothetical protein
VQFYTRQHPFYSGMTLHAWSMYVCTVNQDREVLLHRNMKAPPEPFLKAMAPYHDGLVMAVEYMFTRYWLAGLWAQEGMAFVLGALSMKAIHGGRAKNDQTDSHQVAVWRRGRMLP